MDESIFSPSLRCWGNCAWLWAHCVLTISRAELSDLLEKVLLTLRGQSRRSDGVRKLVSRWLPGGGLQHFDFLCWTGRTFLDAHNTWLFTGEGKMVHALYPCQCCLFKRSMEMIGPIIHVYNDFSILAAN